MQMRGRGSHRRNRNAFLIISWAGLSYFFFRSWYPIRQEGSGEVPIESITFSVADAFRLRRRDRFENGALLVQCVDLQQNLGANIYSKIFAPAHQSVRHWLTTQADVANFSVALNVTTLTGPQKMVIRVQTNQPLAFHLDGIRRVYQSAAIEVELPDNVAAEACVLSVQFAKVQFGNDEESRIFMVRCPTTAMLQGGAKRHSAPVTIFDALLPPGYPISIRSRRLSWFFAFFFYLALPLIHGLHRGRFWAILGAACTLTLVFCFSFLLAHTIWTMKEAFLVRSEKWTRLRRLRVLQRGAKNVPAVFGDGPCCICLDEEQPLRGAQSQQTLIALLPCQHVLHGDCYKSWVCSASYPSRHLLCPMCRSRVAAIGRVTVPMVD